MTRDLPTHLTDLARDGRRFLLLLPGRAFKSAVLVATSVACVSDRPGAPAVQTIEPGVLKVAVTNRSVSDPLDPEYWMVRYVERFGQELGLPIQWQVVPFDRSWELAGKNVVDLVATNVASFADRVSAGGTFSAPFLYERRALRIKASDTSRYRTIADFAGKRVGAVKGMAAGFCIIGRNYDLDDSDETLQKFEDVIFGQDQRVVESQRPERVPFDLADELHLQFDAVAIAYRKKVAVG